MDTDLKEWLHKLSGRDFEHFVAKLWEAMGWETEVTSYRSDDGVDIIAKRDEIYPQRRMIQAKQVRGEDKISRQTIQRYSYLHHKDRVDEVIIVTTGVFTSGAKESAREANVKLIDQEDLITLTRGHFEDVDVDEMEIAPPINRPESEEKEVPPRIPPDDIPDDDIHRIRSLADSPDVYAKLLNGLGFDRYSLQSRLGALLQLFRGSDRIHVLLITPAQIDATALCERVLQFSNRATTVNCAHVNREGLIGRYASFGEVQPGVLTRYNGGIIHLRQLTELRDADEVLAEPLEQGRLTVTADSFHEEKEARFSTIATVRPEHGVFDLYEPIARQIPLSPNLLFTFDSVAVLGRAGTTEFRLPEPYQTPRETQGGLTDKELQTHITLAREQDPDVPSTVNDYFYEIHDLVLENDDMDDESLASNWFMAPPPEGSMAT